MGIMKTGSSRRWRNKRTSAGRHSIFASLNQEVKRAILDGPVKVFSKEEIEKYQKERE